ncbi:MAG: tRNA pseudouridine(54/55) synthase Pus10 [Halobacteriales archaeon]
MELLGAARRILAQAPVCDSCLGRPFADRSHGLTVAERGRALRITVALADDGEYARYDGGCWVCEDLCATFDTWADRVVDRLEDYVFETYQIGSRVPPLYEENERLLREEAGLEPDAGEAMKAEVNREVGKRVGRALDVQVDFGRPDVLAILELEADLVETQINPAFVYGRYRKLERGLPQTEWPCRECGGSGRQDGDPCDHCGGDGYLYADSVEELVAPVIQDAMDGIDATFHGAGREDVDARMLETGRPFVVEVDHPTDRFPDVEALEAAVNNHAADRVEVDDLQLATYEMVERVKELPATKTYRARVAFEASVEAVAFESALSALDGATIEQDTPQRVSHRRAEKTRQRTVHRIDGTLENPSEATIEVQGEGGLYIKELMHGDDGRTRPSLAGQLETEATVTALDVVAVEAAEGRFADPDYLREAPEAAAGD